jgi:hypothetical protein
MLKIRQALKPPPESSCRLLRNHQRR